MFEQKKTARKKLSSLIFRFLPVTKLEVLQLTSKMKQLFEKASAVAASSSTKDFGSSRSLYRSTFSRTKECLQIKMIACNRLSDLKSIPSPKKGDIKKQKKRVFSRIKFATILTKKESRFNGYNIITCLFSTTRFSRYFTSFFVDYSGDFDDDGAGDDVRNLAVDGKRWELPHNKPIFCDNFAVGRTIH